MFSLTQLVAQAPTIGAKPSLDFSQTPDWVRYFFGSIFIILGILLLLIMFFSNKKVQNYRKRQLEQYKKENNIKSDISYKGARLVLPFSKVVQLYGPPILGVTLFFIGIIWITNNFQF
ncbi:hypothetical protein ACW95P_04300 [Candidatus Mycoplasma pogonae]